ncbi:MAG: iron-containing alcohol dehydrogenase [Candidatus Hodarchaeota archaeon]
MSSPEILESVVPRSIIIGKSILNKIPTIIESLGLDPKILVLTGPNTRQIVGEEIFEILSHQEMNCEVMIVEHSSLEAAKTYKDQLEQYNPNILISAGGGKIIDIGKYCLNQVKNKLEMISVPTSTSHDGIASPFIFLNDPTEKYIGECQPPVAIIADVEIIKQHPHLIRHLAAGVGDTVGKITSIWDWQYAWRIKSEKYSRFVGGVLENADSLFQSQVTEALVDPEFAIQVVLKALLIAGVLMGTSNDIRVGYGSEHMFSTALAAETPEADILHGERVALGAIMMAKLQGQDHNQIINILKSAGCPTNIHDLEDEIPPESIIQALQKAHTVHSMYTVLGRTGLTESAALNLARMTKVIDS